MAAAAEAGVTGVARVLLLTLEKKSNGDFEPEEWMGVLAEACEDNATVIYEMDKREEFDVQEYIRSMGGYNKRYRSSMCTLRGWTMVVVGVHCSLMCFGPLTSFFFCTCGGLSGPLNPP